MMRGTKEQHDELFRKENVAEVSETLPIVSEGSRSGKGGEGEVQTRLLRSDSSPPLEVSKKVRCRYDKRIGGWRRVY